MLKPLIIKKKRELEARAHEAGKCYFIPPVLLYGSELAPFLALFD